MKLVLISFHYPPDLGAGAFRMKALVDAFVAIGGSSIELEVLTTQPHRYSRHRPSAAPVEQQGSVTVFRFPVPPSGGRKFALIRSYLAFARQCRRHIAGRQADFVLATASRLVPALIGAYLARRLGAYLHLDIRDLFARNLRQLHPRWSWRPVHWAAAALERRALARADSVSVVSPGFCQHLPACLRRGHLSVHPNGIDPEFIVQEPVSFPEPGADGRIEIVYAGNVGQGQDLELIVPDLAIALHDRVNFTIYGDGAGKESLRASLRERGVDNVQLRGAVARERLPSIYRRAHVLFLHLRPLAAMEAVIPSKLFEYGASGKPILAGVAGISADLLTAEVPNSAVFSPGNIGQALAAFRRLRLCHTPRPAFVTKYNRSTISRVMAQEILARFEGR